MVDSFLPLAIRARAVAPRESGGSESKCGMDASDDSAASLLGSMSGRTQAVAAAHSNEMVALLLTLEGGGTSLWRPSREYVSCPGVLLQTDKVPSCINTSQFVLLHWLYFLHHWASLEMNSNSTRQSWQQCKGVGRRIWKVEV